MFPRMSPRGVSLLAPVHVALLLPLAVFVGASCKTDDGGGSDSASETSVASSSSTSAGADSDTSGTETGGMTGIEPADCGADNVAAGSQANLARWPYVQHVTSSSAVIAWGVVAPGGATPDDAPAGQVRFGRDPAHDGQVAADSVQIIPALPDGGDMVLYGAQLGGLEPATDYCYKVITDGQELAGGLHLRTAPATDDAVVRFAAIGDFGGGTEEQVRVRDQIIAVHERDGIDLILTTGDNAYASGTHVEWQTNVFDVYRELFAEIPFMATIGNHDNKTDEAGPYLDDLFLPRQALLERDQERYYSIDWGPLHFVGLDTERALDDMLPGLLDPELKDPAQQDGWFRADMEANERPWRIAAFHQPTYSNTDGRSPELRMRQAFVPMFEEFGVQLVLQGHNHLYERYHPIKQDLITTTEDGGVVYIVTGGGGKSLYEEDPNGDPWQVTYAEVYHFVYGVIDGCTMTLTAIDIEGVEFDESVITRC